MKSVAIVITNYNSGETIELTLESIRKYTKYPHVIIVGDDGTKTTFYDDLDYLRRARDMGWITLIENPQTLGHGETLAKLLDRTTTDLAMIMDCDIQVKDYGWLEDMVSAQERTGAAMVAGQESFPDGNVAISSWFFMLDMAQYPNVKDNWGYTRRTDGWKWPGTDIPGLRPTGYLIWEKIINQGRHIEPIPPTVRVKYFHHTHISVLSLPLGTEEYKVRQQRYAIIQAELRKLRASNG